MNKANSSLAIKEITIFLVTSNEETTSNAYKSLLAQDCNFKIVEIKNIFPMSKAFQRMADICTTKYFIQVDADMILNTDAISYLYNEIRKTPFWIYRFSGSLYEEGFGKGGAVKCWKKSVFKLLKFKDVRTVDRNFQNRASLLLLRIKHSQKILGIHKPRHSDFSNYLKTKSDIEKWKFLKRKYSKYAKNLILNLTNKHENISIKFVGAIFGSINNLINIKKSKNIYKEELFYTKYIRKLFLKEIILSVNEKEKIIKLFEIAYNDLYCINYNNKIELLSLLFKLYNIKEVDRVSLIEYIK